MLLRTLCTKLHPEIYLPGDHVIFKGDIGNEMFFIVEGAVDILNPESTGINHSIDKGNFVGELALLNKVKRSCSVIAKSFCLLYVLSKEDLDSILQLDEDFAAQIRAIS
jgi:CRP-like cAMP-binding protein